MLILQRKCGERVVIGQNIEVTVLKLHGNHVKLGISGPPGVPIHRQEVHQRIVRGAIAERETEKCVNQCGR